MVIYDSLTIVVTYITDYDTDLKLCRVDIKILQLEYDKFTMTQQQDQDLKLCLSSRPSLFVEK